MPLSDTPSSFPSRVDAALGAWRFSLNLNSGKFEVFRAHRPELAHLTIAWGTASRTLDIHLTHGHEQAGATGADKDWRPLFQVPLAVVEAHGGAGNNVVRQTLVPRLLENYKKYRPGWLATHGYVVAVVDEDGVGDWFATKIAPRHRGKYRVQPSVMLESRQFPRGTVQQYEPQVLHLEVLKTPGTRVQAVLGRDTRSRPESITLSYTLGPDGTVGWWGIKNKHLLSVMRGGIANLFDWLASRITSEHAELFEQIIAGLGLEEDDATRPLVQSMRFVAKGRNPVRRPYPRVG